MFRSTALVHLLVTVLMCLPSLMPVFSGRAASTQVLDGGDEGIYQSPSYGYLLRWDPENWQATEESTDDGVDLLTLESDVTIVTFAAHDAFEGDPKRCLSDASERLREQDFHSLEPAVYEEDGTSAEEYGAGHAYAAFLIVPDTGQRRTEYVIQIECRTLIQDAAVLEITSVISSEDYANGADDGMYLIDNTSLPRGAYVTSPDELRPVRTERTYVDSDADVMLDISVPSYDDDFTDVTLPLPDQGTRWVSVEVEIHNTGGAEVEIDVNTISVADQFGVVAYPAYYEWSEATGNGDEPRQSLVPGDAVAMTLVYEMVTDAEVVTVTCGCGPDPDIPIEIARLQPDPNGVFPPPPMHGCNDLGWDRPSIIVDPSGREVATMTGTLWRSDHRFEFLVAIENSGEERMTIDSRDFVLVANETTSYRVEDVTWDLSSDDDVRNRLAVGDLTLALLSFDIDETTSFSTQLYFRGPQDDQRHAVASNCIGCGCGGGGRPKIRVGQ